MPIHDSVNLFGGFAPFPNSIMIPVMGLQSDVIGFRFGFGYEKGKRTLRAMSNEQFNNLDEEAESKIYKEHDSTAINYFQNEMGKFITLQNLIIEKTVEIEKAKANRTPSATAEVITSFYDGVRNLGEQSKTSGLTWQRLASLLFPFLFSPVGHEHDETSTEVPDIGKSSPGDESPHTKDDETVVVEETPEETPTIETQPTGHASKTTKLRMRVEIFDHLSHGIVSVSNIWHDWTWFQWGVAIGEWNKLMIYLHNTGNPLHRSAAIQMNIKVGTAQVAIFKFYGEKARAP